MKLSPLAKIADKENYGLFHIFGDSITIFNRWNSPLPSNNVYCIYVDSLDIIWIGTAGGVAKLHDTAWTVYTTTNSGLPNNDVNCFKRASDGSMWIAMLGGAVARLKNNQWEVFTPANSPLPMSYSKQIAEDSSGNIWMAAGTSLAVYNPNGVNFAFSPLKSRSGRSIGASVSRLVFGFSSRISAGISGARYFDIRGRDMGRVGFSGQSKGVCIMRRNGAR
jgi:ligand-binding sensor domain-containing protein